MKQSESSQRSKESKYFDELRNENYDNSFPVTEAWLRTANENPLNNKKTERNIIMKLKNYFFIWHFKCNNIKIFMLTIQIFNITNHTIIAVMNSYQSEVNYFHFVSAFTFHCLMFKIVNNQNGGSSLLFS